MTRPQYLQDVPPGRADAHPGTPLQKGKTMNNKTKGVIAGIAGLALLGGGATFATWSDSATLGGATITNGNLDVTATGSMAWSDVSSDTVGAPVAIPNIADWRMVPGDTLEGSQSLTVDVEGDNLVANLLVETTAVTALPDDVTVTYDVFRGTTPEATGVALGTDTPLLGVESDTYTVVVNVDFDIDAEGSMEDTTALQNITVSLTQDR